LRSASAGRVAVRLVEPEYVAEPSDPRGLEDWLGAAALDWRFGVATDLDDAQTRHGYFVQWCGDANLWDFLPESEVHHCQVNVDRGVKRGLSDFYAAWREIEHSGRLLANTLQGAAIQAAIAYIREHAAGMTLSQIDALRASQTDETLQRRTGTGWRTTRLRRIEPGTILDVSHNQKYHAGPLGAPRGPSYVEVVQAGLRKVGVRWCMPEYMVSGDASNANYASTLIAESPFVKAAEARQSFYKRQFRAILWKTLRLAADAGRFRRLGLDHGALRRRVQIVIDAPSIAVRDRLEEERIREIRRAHVGTTVTP
jgi:hypothetical protein